MDRFHMNMTSRRRTAFGLLEALVALLILSLAALPLVRSGTSIHHETYFTEFHVLAAVRARTLLSLASAMDFAVLQRSLGANTGGAFRPVPLDQPFPPGTLDFLLAAPGRTNPVYLQKMSLITHQVTGCVLDDDRIRLEVLVKWTIPAENRTVPHEYRLGCILHRPESTHARPVALR